MNKIINGFENYTINEKRETMNEFKVGDKVRLRDKIEISPNKNTNIITLLNLIKDINNGDNTIIGINKKGFALKSNNVFLKQYSDWLEVISIESESRKGGRMKSKCSECKKNDDMGCRCLKNCSTCSKRDRKKNKTSDLKLFTLKGY